MEKQLKPGSVIRFQRKNGELVIGEVQTVEKENCKVIWNQAGLFGKIRNFKRTVQWKEINQVLQYKSKDGFSHIKKRRFFFSYNNLNRISLYFPKGNIIIYYL